MKKFLIVLLSLIVLTNLNVNAYGFGFKKNDKHIKPEIGMYESILNKTNSYYVGSDEKVIYLTFDAGYEAGYMEKILEVLKQNDVKACFFITAHYLNTQPDLVKQMIDEGHIIGNHTPNYLMSGV